MGGRVSQLKPLCFVLMPFGRKSRGSGRMVDFDATLPFDIASQRGTPYHLDDAGNLTDVAGDVQRIGERMRAAHDDSHDEVVRHAAEQRVRREGDGSGDYWDHANLLELAVLARDQDAAADHAANALAIVREPWEPANTARNLWLIREMCQSRDEDTAWIAEIEQALGQAETRLAAPAGSAG